MKIFRSQVLPYLLIFSSLILFQACGQNKEDKQQYVNSYVQIVTEIKNRDEVIKKGAEAIISYRKSGFMDVDNAEIAKNAFYDGIRLDSIALIHLNEITTPDNTTKEISDYMRKGIIYVMQGNTFFASNYGKAKDQNLEERKETILNVKPGLTQLAQGLNHVVISMSKLHQYIKDNELNGDEQLTYWFKQFKAERDNLRSFINE